MAGVKARRTNIVLSLDAIPVQLTAERASNIRRLFADKGHPLNDADELIGGWPVIREVASQEALKTHLRDAESSRWSPSVRKRRDRQLQRGAAAADRAIAAHRRVLEVVGQHSHRWDPELYVKYESWTASVVRRLEQTKASIGRYRSAARAAPVIPGRPGTRAWLAENILLDVLAAYFRRKGWRVSETGTGLFVNTAYQLLPNTGDVRSMNYRRLCRLARSKQDFPDLEAIAPAKR